MASNESFKDATAEAIDAANRLWERIHRDQIRHLRHHDPEMADALEAWVKRTSPGYVDEFEYCIVRGSD